MTSMETILAGLNSLLAVTELLRARVEQSDLTTFAPLIAQREKLIGEQTALLGEMARMDLLEDERRQVSFHLSPLLKKLDDADKNLVAMVSKKKDEFSGKLQQAKNQQRLLAYSY